MKDIATRPSIIRNICVGFLPLERVKLQKAVLHTLLHDWKNISLGKILFVFQGTVLIFI